MASTYLTRTPSSTGNRSKFTFSFWIKRSAIGSSQTIYNVRPDSNGANRLSFHSGDTFRIAFEPISKYIFTTRKFRDTMGWYHIVVAVDTEQGTAADRVKLYVNGVQEGNLIKGDGSAASYPDQYTDLDINTQNVINIGRDLETSGNYFDGLISHFHFCDGQQLAPTVFGTTDSITGEWRIKTAPSFTPGTNGFTILKDGNTITDQSANSNDFTLGGGSLTFTHDCPSNILSTINRNAGNWVNLSNGALKSVNPNGQTLNYNPKYYSNLGYSAGKYYWETKVSSFSTGSGHSVAIYRTNTGHVPSWGTDSTSSGTSTPNATVNYFFAEATTYFKKWGTNEQSGSVGSTLSSGDIIGISHDVSAGEVKYFVNGSQIGSTMTGVSSANDGYFYMPHWTQETKTSSRYCTMEWNMGNGYFGTTAISTNSGNGYAGAEGKSKFNYQPPTGHCAVSTIGLNT